MGVADARHSAKIIGWRGALKLEHARRRVMGGASAIAGIESARRPSRLPEMSAHPGNGGGIRLAAAFFEIAACSWARPSFSLAKSKTSHRES